MTFEFARLMLNKSLMLAVTSDGGRCLGDHEAMFQFMVAGFVMAVGLCIAGAGTHLYQGVFNQQAMLRYDGKTYLASLGHLVMSFLCGPYIMLQLGWRHEAGETISMSSALISALVGFGWAFITGLLLVGFYLAVTGR